MQRIAILAGGVTPSGGATQARLQPLDCFRDLPDEDAKIIDLRIQIQQAASNKPRDMWYSEGDLGVARIAYTNWTKDQVTNCEHGAGGRNGTGYLILLNGCRAICYTNTTQAR